MIRTFEDRLEDIRNRWVDIDYDRWFWVPPKPTVNILIYAEGAIKFNGGGFDGLQHVIATLQSDPYPWVNFSVTTAHRGSDSSADRENVDLTDLDPEDKYDEIWFFGISGGDLLSSAEKSAAESFMDKDTQGGVLGTGDHNNLGEGLIGDLKRVGEMRSFSTPSPGAPNRYSSLREGPTSGYQFTDQSDSVPQELDLSYTTAWSHYPRLLRVKYPHPVMCGPLGPIDVFPDHGHEGAAIAPSSYPPSDWPKSTGGYQPKVNLVAEAQAVDARLSTRNRWSVVGTYDGHRAEVGRIITDATWHHWFDINLDGFYNPPSGASKPTDVIKQIEAYYLNVAIWLAPPGVQKKMRNAAWWSALFRDPMVMYDIESTSTAEMGGVARNAVGQFAPQCMVRHWMIEEFPFERRRQFEELTKRPDPPIPVPISVDEVALGSVAKRLIEEYSMDGQIVEQYPGDEVLDEVFAEAGSNAFERYRDELGESVEMLREIGGEGFQEQQGPDVA